MIDRETEAKILRLHDVEKWPPSTIATQLGVHHDVVERVLAQSGTPRVRPARPCMIDEYVPFIREMWERYPRLPASRLYRMCQERGYTGRPDHFRHMASRYRPRHPVEAYLRLRTLPGEHYVEQGVMLSGEPPTASARAVQPVGDSPLRIIPRTVSSVRRVTARSAHDRADVREGVLSVVPGRGFT